MKKWKRYASIIVLLIMTALLAFAIYVAVTTINNVSNKTEFITGDENVFVSIEASYEGPEPITPNSQSTFNMQINRSNNSAFDENSLPTQVWNVGRTNFIAHQQETIAFLITIHNLNTENTLNVIISDIAVDFEQKFATKFLVYNHQTQQTTNHDLIAQDSDTTKTQAPNILIGEDETFSIKVEFTLKSYAKDFEFANNMKVLLTSGELA